MTVFIITASSGIFPISGTEVSILHTRQRKILCPLYRWESRSSVRLIIYAAWQTASSTALSAQLHVKRPWCPIVFHGFSAKPAPVERLWRFIISEILNKFLCSCKTYHVKLLPLWPFKTTESLCWPCPNTKEWPQLKFGTWTKLPNFMIKATFMSIFSTLTLTFS